MAVNIWRLRMYSVVGLFGLVGAGCAAPQAQLQARIRQTAADLRAGDSAALYEAHHIAIQAELDPEELRERIARNPKETAELAGALEVADAPAHHRAKLLLANRDHVGLVFEDGVWAIAEGPFGATDVSTPWAAMRAFRAALQHESLGSLRTILGAKLRAKRDFALQMLLEQTADVYALKFSHQDLTEEDAETATFETPAGVVIIFVREGEAWLLQHVEASRDSDG